MTSGRVWQARIAKKKRRLADTTKAYSEIELNLVPLLSGTVVVVDPSIGSNSSMPGWAVYTAGKLVESGVLAIPIRREIPERLQEVARQLRELYRRFKPVDVLVYEAIAPRWYGGGGNANAHASLLKALGAVLSVPGPNGFVGISPQTWKRLVSSEYVKSDEADAIEMGRITLDLAGEIHERNAQEAEAKSGKAAKEKTTKETKEETPW